MDSLLLNVHKKQVNIFADQCVLVTHIRSNGGHVGFLQNSKTQISLDLLLAFLKNVYSPKIEEVALEFVPNVTVSKNRRAVLKKQERIFLETGEYKPSI